MVSRRGFVAIVVASAATLYSAFQCLQLIPNEPVQQFQNGEKSLQKSVNFTVNPIFQQQYDTLDAESHSERCKRYGFSYQEGRKKRRIFFGAMVADEEYEVIRMHATEAYGIYHYVSLVESNSTHTATNRTLRFAPGTKGHELIHSGMFGPYTTVHLDLYLEDAFGALMMDREEIQREEILKRWKMAGMRRDDVGLMADMDETFTRDFLLAIQSCDVKLFRPGQNCKIPKILGQSLVFESSPECIAKDYWFHPDLIIGECIDGIGDAEDRLKPERTFMGVHGERKPGWGKLSNRDYPTGVIATDRYPLANGADFRTGIINHGMQGHYVDQRPENTFYVTAYHFHNFFPDIKTLRHKYLTYGHPWGAVRRIKLGNVHRDDVDVLVRCTHNLPNSASPNQKERYEGGFSDYNGSKPIFFLDEIYRKNRHERLKRMVDEDEKIFGQTYAENGTRLHDDKLRR